MRRGEGKWQGRRAGARRAPAHKIRLKLKQPTGRTGSNLKERTRAIGHGFQGNKGHGNRGQMDIWKVPLNSGAWPTPGME